MSEVLRVNYYRSPHALVLKRRFLTDPNILIEVSRPYGVALPHTVREIAHQKIEIWRYTAEFHEKAWKAVVDYRNDDALVPPGCRKCPIHRLAGDRGAQRVCQGINEYNVTVVRSPVLSTNGDGDTVLRTIFSCKGNGTLDLGKRQRKRLDKATHGSLEEQLALLTQASCVLLPELD